jgi:DNA-binding response OmpR family regulator
MGSLADIQVLIVDDSSQMRQLLRAAGVQRVAEAATALDAFAFMNRVKVDIVLADWRMQPVDGIAFTRMVRLSAESPDPTVPILMLTAHTEASRVAAARDAGVTGFLRKPISTKILFERLSNALLDERPFVRTEDFFGPDRRHSTPVDYNGPRRRAEDNEDDTFDIDDVRCA